ncbi:hypothetical protein Leryth_018615 [Lithospermum erythrorhizon]|nr:hypothetical protein Leryth_018615 [Lithospermum erythrorhizon]
MKGPEMYIVEEISAEFRESLLARVGLKGVVYLKTMPPNSSDEKETEFSFKVDGTGAVKRFAVHQSSVSSLGNGMFHVQLVKRSSSGLYRRMIQYVSNPDLLVPLSNVTIVLKLPVDPTLVKVSPKAILNRSEKELKWQVEEIPLKGNPGRLRVRMPIEIGDDDGGEDLEIFCYVKFSAQGSQSLSGISLLPASETKTDFYEVDHRYESGSYISN